MRPAYTHPCTDCGKPVAKRLRSDRAHLCRPCAARRSAEAAEQMANKSGPAFDKWRASMAGVLAKLDQPAS